MSINAIVKLPVPRQASVARHLFFPLPEEFDGGGGRQGNGVGIGMKALATALAEDEDPDWPVMEQPYALGEVNYKFRRPNFLGDLTDDQYVSVFKRLTQAPAMELPFPDW